MAIVTRYIQSNAKLWQDLTAKIQHARYPEPMRERSSRLTWYSILESTGRLGRMLAEFHIAMTNSRNNKLIDPETNAGSARTQWSDLILHKLDERIYLVRNLSRHLSSYESILNALPKYAHSLYSSVIQSEHLGLLIRIHGHAHLGQVLVGEDGLYLVNYETDSLDDESYRLHKQTCLKDLAATLLSLQFAWMTTERSEDLPVFSEILSADSEFGRHVIKSLENFATPQRYAPNLQELESTLVKSYLQTIAEDSAAIELLPNKKSELENLFSLCMLLRVLKECVRDLRNQNPRYKTNLRILGDLINGHWQLPSFEAFFNSPARSSALTDEALSYGIDQDFS
ncbi:hypothetical protein EBU99_12660 [bacterium]|nr:hypothetical protein [bacterium]